MTSSHRSILVLAAIWLVSSCGGIADEAQSAVRDDASGGNAGSPTDAGARGGTGGSANGGSAGSSGGAVQPGTGGATTPASGGCCNLAGSCPFPDRILASESDCPPGATCYKGYGCCGAFVWCAKPVPADAGPPDGAVCGARATVNRHYTADAAGCATIKVKCPLGTTGFYDDCGCGCEQDASCPDSVDCMPRGPGSPPTNPLCSTYDQCPFSIRLG